MNERLTVTVPSPGAIRTLTPRYDSESDILVVAGPEVRPWPYGLNVDASVVFDLDADRVLGEFDVLAPKHSWRRDLDRYFALPAQKGSIQFTADTVARHDFGLPVEVHTDEREETVLIEIGTETADRELALSDKCVALLAGDALVGFLLLLA